MNEHKNDELINVSPPRRGHLKSFGEFYIQKHGATFKRDVISSTHRKIDSQYVSHDSATMEDHGYVEPKMTEDVEHENDYKHYKNNTIDVNFF